MCAHFWCLVPPGAIAPFNPYIGKIAQESKFGKWRGDNHSRSPQECVIATVLSFNPSVTVLNIGMTNSGLHTIIFLPSKKTMSLIPKALMRSLKIEFKISQHKTNAEDG